MQFNVCHKYLFYNDVLSCRMWNIYGRSAHLGSDVSGQGTGDSGGGCTRGQGTGASGRGCTRGQGMETGDRGSGQACRLSGAKGSGMFICTLSGFCYRRGEEENGGSFHFIHHRSPSLTYISLSACESHGLTKYTSLAT